MHPALSFVLAFRIVYSANPISKFPEMFPHGYEVIHSLRTKVPLFKEDGVRDGKIKR
jgi:hypothetical protein